MITSANEYETKSIIYGYYDGLKGFVAYNKIGCKKLNSIYCKISNKVYAI